MLSKDTTGEYVSLLVFVFLFFTSFLHFMIFWALLLREFHYLIEGMHAECIESSNKDQKEN